jgi:fermentation-respiration switch protein FrsA (DUF1100 family)
MKWLLTLAALVVFAYAAVVIGLYLFQRRLVYPAHTAPYHSVSELRLGNLSEVRLKASDGVELVAWHLPAKAGQPTLLYFHGNAAPLLNRLPRIERFSAAGYGILMPAYRGYSGSGGSASEAALVEDAVTAFDALRERGVSLETIVLYGESLGTGVAIQLAGRREVAGIVLDAPYTSLPDVAQLAYPFVPVRPFMTEHFNSREHIRELDVPVLILHGTEDPIVPISLGRELFSVANEPKSFVAIKGAAHSNIYEYGAFSHLDRFLRTLSRAEADSEGLIPAE